MPAEQDGQPYKLASGKWGIRYYDQDGVRRRESGFESKSATRRHFRDVIAPRLRGEVFEVELTLAAFVPVYLERHAANVRPRTIETLAERLVHATEPYGNVRLRELERMSGELASWQAKLPERSRYGIVQALRQTLGAAERWGYMTTNPALKAGVNRQPSARAIRTYTPGELAAIAADLRPAYAPLPIFVAATGLRPEEWQALERRDVDRRVGILNVLRTVSSGEVVDLGKSDGSRRQVPLSRVALTALDRLPTRLDRGLLFPAPEGGLLNLNNWRKRAWTPAIEAAGIEKPARIYDLRATFISNALAAGVPVFEVSRVAGTSVRMIERHYGRLLDGSAAAFAERMDAFEANGGSGHASDHSEAK